MKRGQWSGVRGQGVLLMLALVFCAVTVFGQTPQATPQPASDQADELKTQEQILDELKFRRAQVTALQGQVKAQADQITTLNQLADTLRERGDFYKSAATDRAGAGVLQAQKDQIRMEQLAEYKDENTRLRSENDALRRSRDRRTIIAFVAGGLGGYALHR